MRLPTAAFLAVWSPLALFGADPSIVGTVADPTGSPISGVRIVATQPAIGLSRETRTDVGGRFQIPNLPIGDYTLRCDKDGFQTVVVSLDLRVTKTIPVIHGRGRVLISLDSYNLANHTNALRVSPYFTSTYRGLVESLNARQFQLGGQFEF